MPNGDDHDLLIRIDSKMDSLKESYERHLEEDAKAMGVITRDVKTAHRRIDWLFISGVLALVFFGLSLWFNR